MKWETKPLTELADFCLGKMLDQKKNRGELRPYLANINVRWGEFDLEALREMRFEEHEEERFGLKAGDIIMCEGGEPGRCAIWKEQRERIMLQKALHRIRPFDLLDHRFLYYTFVQKGNLNEFESLFTGSTIKHLPKQMLAKVEISYPPLPIQKRIADILSAYDDLIENNRRRMALLEQSARELYREWFVRLRFPGHEHCKIINGLPAGWERKTLGSVSDFLKRGLTPKYDEEAEGIIINQKCIRNGRLNLDLARRQKKDVPEQKLLRFGDVLINSTGEGTLGRVAQYQLSIENCTADSHVTIVRSKPSIPRYFFGLVVQEMEPQLSSMGRGATNQTELSPMAVGEMEIIIPSKAVTSLFEENVALVSKEVLNLTEQNQKLRTARDLLLPKLMNGEIAV